MKAHCMVPICVHPIHPGGEILSELVLRGVHASVSRGIVDPVGVPGVPILIHLHITYMCVCINIYIYTHMYALYNWTLETIRNPHSRQMWELQKDQTACSCFEQGSVSHTSTKHPMRQHCNATNSWGQVPSKFSRANAAAEAMNQILHVHMCFIYSQSARSNHWLHEVPFWAWMRGKWSYGQRGNPSWVIEPVSFPRWQ